MLDRNFLSAIASRRVTSAKQQCKPIPRRRSTALTRQTDTSYAKYFATNVRVTEAKVLHIQESRIFQSVHIMLPKSSREWRRHAVKRIIVEHMETSRKTGKRSLKRINPKLYENLPTNKSAESTGHKLLTEYLQDSSIHGIKYLSNLRIRPSIVGKIYWALIIICSFVFLIWMVSTIWMRYSADPLRTVVESFEEPIFKIPFPAVTLCPLIPPLAARRKKLLARLHLPDNINSTTAMFLLKYGVAFSSERVPGGRNHLNNLRMLLEYNNITLLELVKLLRPCEDLVESCWWDGVKMNCSQIFKASHTSQGICCSFNFQLEHYISEKNWLYPVQYLRTAYFGSTYGLTVIIHPKLLMENDGTGEFIKYSTNSVGILVYAHHPLEYLGPIAKRHLLQAQQELRICDWANFDCLYENADNIRRMVQKDPSVNITCKCYSPCWDIFYDTQASIGILNRHESNSWPGHKNLTEAQSIVKVFMNYETFTMTDTIPIADELYLLASVGGIFSLFVGASFISAVEIFYFIGLYLQSYRNSKKSK
ncbi:sodium channel protein Nach-like isoform X4 [Odontomachus brunneus]|uniref:sodium channel protein Nach-like isoform X4 n=1 Tax=Odontomachus brunneus TaxID=486640 RepID=UPI0013F22F88|nr:sodium channel protein Nach-like isoform X4 [Odontomachus brunneus]